MTIEELYQIYRQYPSVQTDTRKLKTGDLFFALKGPSFNGNSFASQALEAGAAYAIIDEAAYATDSRCILVEDVLDTLQQLARHHRQTFTRTPFIAITGSNGKTTTKELVHAVLSSRFITYTTQGNLNNHIGIPLTLLSVKPDAEFAVIEMGANHQKEIESYCRYTLPTHGIITNVGKAHLEGFGGEEGVRKGKGELFDYIRAHKGTVFIMSDYDYLREMSDGIHQVYRYGSHDADLIGNMIKSEPFLEVSIKDQGTIQTNLVGEYNFPNVLVAVAVGTYFGVPFSNIKEAIENYTPSNSRSQMVEKDGNQVILDAYNANPSSMKAAIENFAKLPYPSKILMLGAMAELGSESIKEHESLISLIQKYPWQQVVLVGGDFMKIDHPFLRFANSQEAAQWFKDQHFSNKAILVKGSRSMQMEKVLS